MGSHWDYSKRYPDSFDYFRPSGKTVSINPPKRSEKRTIINSYDNSVRYSDFIIDSVIQIVKKFSLVSYVTYVSDHGEDLFNLNKDQLNFHLTASRNTLHVPLFIWTSDRYNRIYPSKISALLSHQDSKIGENDIFYTLLNLANITFPGFDSTKSISSNAFKDSRQEYIEQGDNHPKYYSKLPQ
jgi:glucan phosphoethanolaminetransferase (alkaline phosphatase superfamily)